MLTISMGHGIPSHCGILLLLHLLYATLLPGTSGAELITVVSPVEASVYNLPTVPLTIILPQEVELSAESLVLCVDVSWSLGEQSFCKEKLEGWALRGLDSGDYNVRVTLHEVIKLSAEDTGARTRVVAEARRGFRVQLEHEEEKVQITWPRGRETITVGEVQKVEVSFRTQAFEGVVEGGRVCLGNTALGDGQYGCVGSGDNWAAVRVKEGWNEVQAILVDGEGRKREGEWTTHSAGFWVEFSGDAGKGLGKGSIIEPHHNKCNLVQQQKAINPVVISCRSRERYEEAEVMLKSLFMNWGRSSDGETAPAINLHLVVDQGGLSHFRRVLPSLPNVCVRYYDFHKVCEEEVQAILDEFDFRQSAHYSGKAGYCRLALPKHIEAERFIAIETDQLFLHDVSSLFGEFDEIVEKSGAAVAAPEMYMPWYNGRPGGGKAGYELIDSNAVTLSNKQGGEDGWHGNGYIGGIMAFDKKRLLEVDWKALWRAKLHEFIELRKSNHGEEDWEPNLNDQDIFNAIFTLSPELAGNFGCSWNWQYHAFMNVNRLCEREWEVCERAAEPKENMFLCRERVNVVHFMAGSYRQNERKFLSSMWEGFHGVGWDAIAYMM